VLVSDAIRDRMDRGKGIGSGEGEREKGEMPGCGGGGQVKNGRGWQGIGRGSRTGLDSGNGKAKWTVICKGEVGERDNFCAIVNDLAREAREFV